MACQIITIANLEYPGYIMGCKTHNEAPQVEGSDHCVEGL